MKLLVGSGCLKGIDGRLVASRTPHVRSLAISSARYRVRFTVTGRLELPREEKMQPQGGRCACDAFDVLEATRCTGSE